MVYHPDLYNLDNRQSPVRGGSGSKNQQVQPGARVRASPTTGPVRPTMSADARKSRVRDTVKLFDSKTGVEDLSSRAEQQQQQLRAGNGNTNRRSGSANVKRNSLKSPKTGAGEAMALEDTGGNCRR